MHQLEEVRVPVLAYALQFWIVGRQVDAAEFRKDQIFHFDSLVLEVEDVPFEKTTMVMASQTGGVLDVFVQEDLEWIRVWFLVGWALNDDRILIWLVSVA